MITTAYFGPNSVPDANEYVGDFASRIIWGEPGWFVRYCSMGVFRDNDLIGAAIYSNWDSRSGVIELSLASSQTGWITRHVIKQMFNLPFNKLHCQLVITHAAQSNRRSIRLSEALPFKKYEIPRLSGRNENGLIFTLSDEDWRASKFHTEGER